MAKKIGKHNGQDVFEYLFSDVEVKAVGENELEIIGSTEAMDRDGEVLKMDGWDLKEWKKNPVILPAHDYTAPAIAKGKVRKSDGKLKFKIEFPEEGVYPLADIYRKLYKGGFMRASSVGFMPTDWKYGEGKNEPYRTYLKQKLLELSLVSVPSNPEALSGVKGVKLEDVKTAREKGIENEKAYEKFFEAVEEAVEKKEDKIRQANRADWEDKDEGQARKKSEPEQEQEPKKEGIDVRELIAKELVKIKKELEQEREKIIEAQIEKKLAEKIEEKKDKNYWKELLFGPVGDNNPNASPEKEKVDKLIDFIKDSFK